MRVGFIGLGQMGSGMASRLIERGHELVVWNRTPGAAERLREQGATIARDAGETLDSELVISMLADDTACEGIWIASGLLEHRRAADLHVNMASVSVAMAQRLTDAHGAARLDYVAAPVFGRPSAAAGGQLDIVAAGPAHALARCAPLFDALGRNCFHAGETPRHANVVKIARNFMLGSIIEALGEAFALAQRSGVAPATFLDIITSTSMNAPAYKYYGRFMVNAAAESTFPLRLGLKDIELALAAAADAEVALPLAQLMREQHIAAIAHGFGERDWAALGNYIMESSDRRSLRP